MRAHSGQIGFMICAKANAEGPPLDPRTPRRPAPDAAVSGYPPLRCDLPDMAIVGPQHPLDRFRQNCMVLMEGLSSASMAGTCAQPWKRICSP